MLGICVGSSRCSLPLSPVSCSPTKTGGVDLDAASLNSVQFEEDFNIRTKNLGSGVGVGVGGYVRPDQFLYHLTVIKTRCLSQTTRFFLPNPTFLAVQDSSIGDLVTHSLSE